MSNENSSIYIYLSENNNSNHTKTLKVYRAGYNGMTDSSILSITPPSRPMGIKVEDYYPENGSWCVPIVKWNHNKEPDMLKRDNTKRYKVYRATQSDMNSVPGNYIQIADVFINKDSTPSYIDYDVLRYDCALLDQNPPFGTKYPARYKVKAFDDNGDSSVFSDFASTEGITQEGGIEDGGDHISFNNNIPKNFNLSQNYPNPFNPTTSIHFKLPKATKIMLMIYNSLGQFVRELANGYYEAGEYVIQFEGKNLASGIYYYRLEAEGFSRTNKMLLLK